MNYGYISALWIALVGFSVAGTIHAGSHPLLQCPDVVTREELAQRMADWRTSFTWKHALKCAFNCIYQDNQAGCRLTLFGIPVRSYQMEPAGHSSEGELVSEPDCPYYFARPLKRLGGCPQAMSPQDLASLMRDKTCVWYTGAGISAASVPSMSTLEQSLCMDRGAVGFLYRALLAPRAMAQTFEKFCRAAIDAEPTLAHRALKELALKSKTRILTENVDLLQEKTGVSACLVHHNVEMHALSASQWKQIDALVCIGLSHDDCGLLARFRQENPEGVIIALNISCPDYLSSHDIIVLGDIQETLPAIALLYAPA